MVIETSLPSDMFHYLVNYNTLGTNIDYVFFDFMIFSSYSVYINYIPVLSNVLTLYTKIHVNR